MKRLALTVLTMLLLAVIPFGILAEGAGETTASTDESLLRETFRFDFEDGSTSGLFPKSSQICEVRELGGNRYLAYGLKADYSGGSYLQMTAKDLSNDYLTDSSVSDSKQYYNSETFTLSMSFMGSEKPPANSYIEFKNAGKSITVQLLHYRDGVVSTPSGTALGQTDLNAFLNVTITLNVTTGAARYFVDGDLVTSETLSKTAANVSYFNFYIAGSEGNALSEIRLDNLSLCFGEVSEDNEAYFRYAFEGVGQPNPVSVRFVSSQGTVTESFTGNTFRLPDSHAYWYARVDGERRIFEAGSEIPLLRDLTFTAIEDAPTLLAGASIRADGSTGLRFGAVYDVAWYDSLSDFFGDKALTPGVLIVPTDYLADGTAFTHAALSAKYGVLADIENRQWYAEQNGEYSCYGTLTELRDENYARKFSARAYLKITDDAGQTQYLYSEYVEADHARSAHQVATAAYADASADYTPEMREAIKGYLDGVLALIFDGSAVEIAPGPAGYSSPYTLDSVSGETAVVSIASGTTLRSVTVNGTPIYDFSIGNASVTVTLTGKGN